MSEERKVTKGKEKKKKVGREMTKEIKRRMEGTGCEIQEKKKGQRRQERQNETRGMMKRQEGVWDDIRRGDF